MDTESAGEKEATVTIVELQRIVLRLGNQMFVRHYLWLNYPNDPQLMGIQFAYNPAEGLRKRKRSCECGVCEKCLHRNYMQAARGKEPQIFMELRGLGFGWNTELKMWTISRSGQ